MIGVGGSERARKSLAFLRAKIVSGEWPINARIPKEPELMELLGVGKSTVREAVRSLASVGMLETLPGRGTFVRAQTPVSFVMTEHLADFGLTEILVYRRALEVEAAQQAAMHRTDAHLAALRAALDRDRPAPADAPSSLELGKTPGPFHHLVVEASGNRLMASLYSGVMAVLRDATATGSLKHGDAERRVRDHEAIYRAIVEQNPVAAAHATAEHVDHDLIECGANEKAPEPSATR